MGALKLQAVLAIAKMAYRMILRDLLKDAINDPEKEWDELVLSIVDAVFQFEEEEEE